MHYFKLLVAVSLFAAPQTHSMCKTNIMKSFSAQVTAKPEWLAFGAAAVCSYYAYKNYNIWDGTEETVRRNTETADSVYQVGEYTRAKELNDEARNLENHAPEYRRKAQLYTIASLCFGIITGYLWYKK